MALKGLIWQKQMNTTCDPEKLPVPTTVLNPFGANPIFGQVQKFFLENLLLARFLCWRDISRDLFFREGVEVFFHMNMKKK